MKLYLYLRGPGESVQWLSPFALSCLYLHLNFFYLKTYCREQWNKCSYWRAGPTSQLNIINLSGPRITLTHINKSESTSYHLLSTCHVIASHPSILQTFYSEVREHVFPIPCCVTILERVPGTQRAVNKCLFSERVILIFKTILNRGVRYLLNERIVLIFRTGLIRSIIIDGETEAYK